MATKNLKEEHGRGRCFEKDWTRSSESDRARNCQGGSESTERDQGRMGERDTGRSEKIWG